MFFLSRYQKFSLLFLSLASSSSAASFDRSGFHITIEPIVGYEFKHINTPTSHTRGMLIYGGRITAGHKLISAEGEYTLGNTNEVFVTQDQNVRTSKQNIRLGLRSALMLNSWLDFLFRGGGQASKLKIETTTISTATTLTSAPDWEIHPYAGIGFQGTVADSFSLALEATYLFRSVQDWSQNEVQTSASIQIHFPRK